MIRSKKYYIDTVGMVDGACPYCDGVVRVYTVKGEETRLYSSCVSCGMLMDGDVRLNDLTERQDKKNSEEFRRYQISKKLENKKGKRNESKNKRIRTSKKKKKSK